MILPQPFSFAFLFVLEYVSKTNTIYYYIKRLPVERILENEERAPAGSFLEI
jgi:hypothetical protein